MSTNPAQPPSESRGVSPELKEMLAFISAENDRNRDFFNDLFEKSRTFLLILLAAISIGVGFVGYKTIHDAKQSAEAAAASVVSNRLKELTPKIDQQVAAGVSSEFATPKIDQLVAAAADNATQRLAAPLIQKQVEQRVATLVKRTDSEVNKIVTDAVTPQLQQLVAGSAEANQFAFAKVGDGIAFDNLGAMAKNRTLPEQVRLNASIDLGKVMREFPSQVPNSTGCRDHEHAPQFYEDQISDENLAETLNALGCLELWGWPIHDLPAPGTTHNGLTEDQKRNLEMLKPSMERLFQVACDDPRLYVRVVAFRVFQALAQAGGRPFPLLNPLDRDSLIKWWFDHRAEYIKTP